MTPAQQDQRMRKLEAAYAPKYRAELMRFAKASPGASVVTHAARLRVILEANMQEAGIQSGAATLLSLGKSALLKLERKASAEDIVATAAHRYAKKWSARRAGEIAATSDERVARAVAAGIANNDPPPVIAQAIASSVGSQYRGLVIAQTETHSAWNAGSLETAKDADLGLVKVWDAANDDRTRPDHEAAHGQAVGLEDSFDVGGESLDYPGDPSGSGENVISCRCVQTFRPA